VSRRSRKAKQLLSENREKAGSMVLLSKKEKQQNNRTITHQPPYREREENQKRNAQSKGVIGRYEKRKKLH